MQNAEIRCDACDKVVAKMRTSSHFLQVVEEESDFNEIRCLDCAEKEIKK